MTYTVFIGIDQTGAINKNGHPKPLNICIIDAQRKKIKIYTKIKIKSLCYETIHFQLKKFIPKFNSQNVLICVDSVFGLPQQISVPFSKVLDLSKDFSFKNKKYGAMTAYTFFNQFIKSKTKFPQRTVEKRVKANSVFSLKPFQKNIGCGSYRIIKELSADPSWYSVWPFEKQSRQFVFAEGYPSFFWKQIFKLKSRNVTELKQKIKNLAVDTIDEADSFVLAYGAMKSVHFLNTFKVGPKLKNEGWILGVPQ